MVFAPDFFIFSLSMVSKDNTVIQVLVKCVGTVKISAILMEET